MRDNVNKFQREQLAMARSVQKVILSSTLASVRTAATIGPEILTTLSTEVEKFKEKALRQIKIVLEMSNIIKGGNRIKSCTMSVARHG